MKFDAQSLITYSFWWSLARLLVAALALFLGGIPPINWLMYTIGLGGLPIVYSGLTVAWLISGVAAIILAYHWHKGGMKLFGEKRTIDIVAFGIAVVSGLNLGFVGLSGMNIGMTITSNYVVFVIAGLAYLWAAYHLYTRFSASRQKIF